MCNPVINKTSKIRLFHEQTLVDISKLYRWTGPKHWKQMSKIKDVKKKAEDVSAEDLIQVRRECVFWKDVERLLMKISFADNIDEVVSVVT